MIKMPVGVSNFAKLIKKGYYFIDKTKFLCQIIDNHADVTLFARPRRFGKTLTMSMVDSFFNIAHKDEVQTLFKGTYIASADQKYMGQAGTKPVLFLSLKDLQAETFSSLLRQLGRYMAVVYMQYHFVLDQDGLLEPEKDYFQRIEAQKADSEDLQDSLCTLVQLLSRYYGRPTILLLDEYDAPIQFGWSKGYYDQVITFMRTFLSRAFKDNPGLDFALITGVLRIAKESIFSGLNNFKVSTVVSGGYADAFGFTRDEVRQMTIDTGHEAQLPEIAEWYDGYDFQGVEIYNPWSVINYFDNACEAAAYWVNTSSNSILNQLISEVDEAREQELLSLLSGDHITTSIHESIVYPEIGESKDDLYTLLLLTGYLKSVGKTKQDGIELYELAIPNQEIRNIYRLEILEKLTGRVGKSVLFDMTQAMIKGKPELFASYLRRILLSSVSVHDTAKPECFYHGFMLGITVWLSQSFSIQSNRESGYGRFDLALIPKKDNLPGIIMEFKSVKMPDDLVSEAKLAKQQIADKAYVTSLKAAGVQPIWTYGIAFSGKHVEII